jgi:cytochrome c-type biogenesis protein CcsB
MDSATLLSGVALIYLLSWFGFVIYAFGRWKWLGRTTSGIWVLALSLNTVGIVLRWVESYRLGHGHVPVSNQYESMVLFAWTIGVLYVLLEVRYRIRTLGAFIAPMPFLSLGLASLLFEDEIRPLVPALQSNWLTAHVVTCFLGYAAFAVSFGVSVLYLIKGGDDHDRLKAFPSVSTLDDMNHRAVAVGFSFLSVGIITGAVWADVAWGTYWSWDPKETWSLITWIVYAFFLHSRFVRGWTGKRTAIVSIAGFMCVLFTYFGVNFLLSGLHSYA